MSSHLRKNPRDALGGDVISEFTLEKKPRDDNEPRASQLVVIFYIFLGVTNDSEPPWLVVISLLFFSGVVDDVKPPWLIVIPLFFFSGVINDDKPPWLVVISLFFFSGVNDDESEGALSFLSFFLRCRRLRRAERLVVIF